MYPNSPHHLSMAPETHSAAVSRTECPVCSAIIPLKVINEHVDRCLQTKGQREDGPSNKSTQMEKKKRSMLDFGSSPPRESYLNPAKIRKIDPKNHSTESGNISDMPSLSSNKGENISSLKNKEMDQSQSLLPPLAELVRPTVIEEFVGQENVVGKDSVLHAIIETGDVPSMIFWGPPGCGKTTLARIVAKSAKKNFRSKFVQLSAASAGVADVKEVVKVAKNHRNLLKRKTVLFLDEIHRFNKLQQDTFLPHVEDGTITLLGTTTENPSFQLNSALLSRCKVIVMEKLQSAEINGLLKRALRKLQLNILQEDGSGLSEEGKIWITEEAIGALADLCDGDARSALNGLQLVIQTKKTLLDQNLQKKLTQDSNNCLTLTPNSHKSDGTTQDVDSKLSVITLADVKSCLQKTHLLYDRAGDEHYHTISALHKSMRGSDENASLYWLARMLCGGEDPIYVARRIICFASEDIGLADTNALPQAVAAFNACQLIGMPGCEVNLAQAVVYMARAPKSTEVYQAYGRAKSCVWDHKGPLPSVPLHLRNAPTKLMKDLGYGKGYKYYGDQTYLPDELKDVNFFG